jgi:P pilus assembly chaperone PapD
MKTLLKTSFFLILMVLILTNLKAQDFEVAPVRVTFNAVPGETQTRSVTLKNHSNRKEAFTVRPQDFLVQRNGRSELLPAGSTRNSISNWINVNPSFVELEPNESRTIQINLQAPSEDFSSKWGLLSFVTTREQTAFHADRDLQTGVSLSGRIDIYVTYNPASSEPGRLDINRLQEVFSVNPDEMAFTVNLDNISERIVVGRLFLIASNLVTGHEQRFRTVEVTTYPQTSRTVEISIPKNLPAGKYSMAAILDYAGSPSLKGTQIILDIE